jgi:hypothetical protein
LVEPFNLDVLEVFGSIVDSFLDYRGVIQDKVGRGSIDYQLAIINPVDIIDVSSIQLEYELKVVSSGSGEWAPQNAMIIFVCTYLNLYILSHCQKVIIIAGENDIVEGGERITAMRIKGPIISSIYIGYHSLTSQAFSESYLPIGNKAV